MNDSSNKMKVSLKEKAEVSNEKIEDFKQSIEEVDHEQSPAVQKVVAIASTILVGITLSKRLYRKIIG